MKIVPTCVSATHEKLKMLGLAFDTPPTKAGPVTIAIFEDTRGNLIQIVQELPHQPTLERVAVGGNFPRREIDSAS